MHDEMVGIVLVGLVDNHEVILHHHLVNDSLVIDVTRGIVWVAEPQHAVLLVSTGKQLAGVFILAERRTRNVGLQRESLCNEVDGLGSPVGDDDLFRGDVLLFGNQLFQRPCLRFRIVAGKLRVSRQVTHQRLMAPACTDVRREVGNNVLILVGVVAVSFNHCWSRFDRYVPYRHAGGREQPACRIAGL